MENKTGDKNIFKRTSRKAAETVKKVKQKIRNTPTPEELAKMQADYEEKQKEWLRLDNDDLFTPIGFHRF